MGKNRTNQDDQLLRPAGRGVSQHLPEVGYVRLFQIIGKPDADPPIPAVIPVGKSTWWSGIKAGRYPAGVKISPRCTAWRVQDIRSLIEREAKQADEV